MKTPTRMLMLLAAVPMLSVSFATESSAKVTCVYQGIGSGNKVVQGVGTHRKKMDKACKKARKKCEKALKKLNSGRPIQQCGKWGF